MKPTKLDKVLFTITIIMAVIISILITILLCTGCYKHAATNREAELTKYEMQALQINDIQCECNSIECECIVYLDEFYEYNKKQIKHFIETRYTPMKVKLVFKYE